MNRPRVPWLLLVAVAVPLSVTLAPAPEAQSAAERTPWWCIACGAGSLADATLNTLLLVPLGAAAHRLGWRFRSTVIGCLVLAICIELVQGLLIVGRDASISDVITNTLGGALGWTLARHWRTLAHPAPRAAAVTAAALAVAAMGWGVMASSLLRPAMARAEYTRVRFAPPVAGRPTYAGSVLAFSLNGAMLRDRQVPDSLPAGDVAAEAMFVWADQREGTAMIVRVDGADGDGLFSIDVRGRSLGVYTYSLASHHGLRSPSVAVELPDSLRVGDTVRVSYSWRGNHVAVAASAPNLPRSTVSGTFRPWHGWLLLNPFTGAMRFDWEPGAWTLAWIGTWLGLSMWFGLQSVARRSGLTRRALDGQ